MATLDDGLGKNGPMEVNEDRRGNVSSSVNPRIFYSSRDKQSAYNAIMPEFGGSGAAAGNYVFYLKNDSKTEDIFIQHIEFHSVNSVKWKVWEVTGTAAGGTTITPGNLNLGSGKTADATCMGGGATITGLTTVKQIGTHRTEANGEGEMDYGDALILKSGNAIAVEYDTGTTGECEIDCFFHFEPAK